MNFAKLIKSLFCLLLFFCGQVFSSDGKSQLLVVKESQERSVGEKGMAWVSEVFRSGVMLAAVGGVLVLTYKLANRAKKESVKPLIETADNFDLEHAKEILDSGHVGLDRVKEQILDFLASRKLSKTGKSLILCLHGPAGVGKTSIAKSIAKCMGRRFSSIALGGVADAAELAGRPPSYVNSRPSLFYNALHKGGSVNPVMLLDEMDKLRDSALTGGSASAVLLEALDVEQNQKFEDRYFRTSIDLSKVLFIVTANDLARIPDPLRDRMELIEISGYSVEEKMEIARKITIPRVVGAAGLIGYGFELSDEVLREIIKKYDKEPGVRVLARRIERLCMKSTREIAEGRKMPVFTKENIAEYFG
ncbi:AAA family ATPase [Candidatus Babeliales bacterium]|nr:AAA family ATPase [Candidatus Babeliales bacterium]